MNHRMCFLFALLDKNENNFIINSAPALSVEGIRHRSTIDRQGGSTPIKDNLNLVN
jgi:hypothetical protein